MVQSKLKLSSDCQDKLLLTMIEPYKSSIQLMRWTVTMTMAVYSAITISGGEKT
jgi:hypothetical protein